MTCNKCKSMSASIRTQHLKGNISKAESVVHNENDYEKLVNKPSVNGETLIKNKSLPDLGLSTLANSEIKELYDTIIRSNYFAPDNNE